MASVQEVLQIHYKSLEARSGGYAIHDFIGVFNKCSTLPRWWYTW